MNKGKVCEQINEPPPPLHGQPLQARELNLHSRHMPGERLRHIGTDDGVFPTGCRARNTQRFFGSKPSASHLHSIASTSPRHLGRTKSTSWCCLSLQYSTGTSPASARSFSNTRCSHRVLQSSGRLSPHRLASVVTSNWPPVRQTAREPNGGAVSGRSDCP